MKNALKILLLTFPLAAGAQSNLWTEEAAVPTAIYGAAVGAINGSIYTTAGISTALQVYNPASNTWTNGLSIPFSSIYATSAGVINGKLYVAGGQVQTVGNVRSVEVYDPLANTWTTLASMPAASAAAGSGVINGKLYVAGGALPDNLGIVNSLLVYDPGSNTWTTLAPMPTALTWPATAVVNGILYVMGGDNGSNAVNTVEAYDPVANAWTAKAPMPTACEEFNAGVINGIIYAISGESNGQGTAPPLNIVQAYDPARDAWSMAPAMPTPRGLAGVAVVNGVLYAIGGIQNGAGVVATNEAFVPAGILSINMYAGLTLAGALGSTNVIEYKNSLNDSNWTVLTNVVLTSSPYLFIDTTSTFFSQRFYQAFPLP